MRLEIILLNILAVVESDKKELCYSIKNADSIIISL